MSKTKMVEVIIDSVRVSLTNQQRIVVLRDINAERYLPIWIGPYEAESITIALQEIEVSRPQTHDLIKNIFIQLNARLIRIEVLSLKDDVFYGNLIVDINGDLFEIDSRPSDALALAARTHAKILVSEEVMDSAGIVPEVDIQESDPQKDAPLANTNQQDDDVSEERLSVFEDFLGSLDIGGVHDDKPDEESSDDDDSDKDSSDDDDSDKESSDDDISDKDSSNDDDSDKESSDDDDSDEESSDDEEPEK